MDAVLTKLFRFSASHAHGTKVLGHNYALGVLVAPLGPEEETAFAEKVETSLIRRLDSRDLGQDVDFLRGVAIADEALLRAFWRVLEPAVAPVRLRGLWLERDSRTRTTLSA